MIGRGLGIENFAIHLFAGMVLVNYFTEIVTAAPGRCCPTRA